MYTQTFLGQIDDSATTNYLLELSGYQQYAGNLLQQFRPLLDQWVRDARGAGVEEAVIITRVLSPANAWDQATADLADVVISREIQRVQQGGAPGTASAYRPTMPPAFPDIATLTKGTAPSGPITVAVSTAQGGTVATTGATTTTYREPTAEERLVMFRDQQDPDSIRALAGNWLARQWVGQGGDSTLVGAAAMDTARGLSLDTAARYAVGYLVATGQGDPWMVQVGMPGTPAVPSAVVAVGDAGPTGSGALPAPQPTDMVVATIPENGTVRTRGTGSLKWIMLGVGAFLLLRGKRRST